MQILEKRFYFDLSNVGLLPVREYFHREVLLRLLQ